MGFSIRKEFSLCYGHRVHTQVLDKPELSIDTACKCRHLHGHEGLIEVRLSAEKLTPGGMVTDFKNLGWLKEFLDNNLDHKMIVDSKDPLAPMLLRDVPLDPVMVMRGPLSLSVGHAVNPAYFQFGPTMENHYKELAGGLFFVPFVPTSENFARWLFEIVKFKMLGVATVSSVVWWETPKSYAEYSEPLR